MLLNSKSKGGSLKDFHIGYAKYILNKLGLQYQKTLLAITGFQWDEIKVLSLLLLYTSKCPIISVEYITGRCFYRLVSFFLFCVCV